MAGPESLTLQIIICSPVVGALGGMQVGAGSSAKVEAWAEMTEADHVFTFQADLKEGRLPLRGLMVQKDGKGRFVYIVWRGGQGTISRRAKVYVDSIDQAMVDEGRPLTVVLPGTARDGLPCCATVKPLQDWH